MVCVDLVVQVSQASHRLDTIGNLQNKKQFFKRQFLLFSSLESRGHFSANDFSDSDPKKRQSQAKLACGAVSVLEQQLYYSLVSIANLELCLQKQSDLGLLCFKTKQDRIDGKNQVDSDVELYCEDAIVKSFIIGIDLLKKEYNAVLQFAIESVDGSDLTTGLES